MHDAIITARALIKIADCAEQLGLTSLPRLSPQKESLAYEATFDEGLELKILELLILNGSVIIILFVCKTAENHSCTDRHVTTHAISCACCWVSYEHT